MKKKIERYATVRFEVRKSLGISCAEYCLCEMIYHLSNNPSSKFRGWANASNQRYADDIGVTVRGLVKMKNRMVEQGLITQNAANYKCLSTTQKWYDAAVEGRTNHELSSPLTMNLVHGNHELSSPLTMNLVHGNHELSSGPSDSNRIVIEDINRDIFLKEKFQNFKSLKTAWAKWIKYLDEKHRITMDADQEESQLQHLANCGENDVTEMKAVITQAMGGKHKMFIPLLGKKKVPYSTSGKYPEQWSKTFEKNLKPEQFPSWWKHLRKLGYKPVKHNSEIVRWDKPQTQTA